MRFACLAIALSLLAGCDGSSGGPLSNSGSADVATLYSNSPLADGLRVHFATFDASDGLDFNFPNCEMTARLLNANIQVSAAAEGKRPHEHGGFWCETDEFSEDGPIPSDFPLPEFPTDTRSQLKFTE